MIYLYDRQKNVGYNIKNSVLIGREPSPKIPADEFLTINHPQISRSHARILSKNNRYYIVDIRSTNGTFLDGQQLTPGKEYFINNHSIISLGPYQLSVSIEVENKISRPVQDYQADKSIILTDSEIFIRDYDKEQLSVVANDEHQPDVSMVIDASQFINMLRQDDKQHTDNYKEVVRRLQVMIEVSIALGDIEDANELLGKISAAIFDIFPLANRTSIVSYDQKQEKLSPLLLRDRAGNETETLNISKTIIKEVLNNKNSLLLMDALSDNKFNQQESIINLELRSVMCAPLLYKDQILGFIQVDTNKGDYIFSQEDLHVLTGIAYQAAIALKNSHLFEEIEELFEGFVKASVQAIEARDPSTAGHSFRVAEYTEKLAIAIDRCEDAGLKEFSFNKKQLQEIRYAALLHDFGKVGVREHVLTKAKKLYPHELEIIKQRFKYAKTSLECRIYKELVDQHINEKFSHTEFYARKKNIEKILKTEVGQLEIFLENIINSNEPEHLLDELHDNLNTILEYEFKDHNQLADKLLTDFEHSRLSLTYGSLNQEERREIQSHVSHTFSFLQLIPWTDGLDQVPCIAHAHHERLDGSGYPQGLVGNKIPVQARMMAITDVYDALTAGDRAYREGASAEVALSIIEDETKRGRLDDNMFRIFVESKSFIL